MEDGRKRQVFLVGAVLLAVVALLTGWYFTLRKGVYLGDGFFYRKGETRYEQNRSNYIERTSEKDFQVVLDSGTRTVSVHGEGGRLTFDFVDGDSHTGFWGGENFVGDDGMPIGWEELLITNGEEPEEISNAACCQTVGRIYLGEEETISAWYLQAFGILFYLLGIVTILKPEEVHFFLIRWRYHNPELSETGRVMEQISGVVLAAAGLSMMSGVLLLLIG